MIPYFGLNQIPLGPLHIQVWGLFVSLGVLAALLAGRRESRRLGLNIGVYLDMAAWMFLAAIIGGRLFYVVYDPRPFLDDGWEIFRIWDGGMSIFGGFLGALAAGAACARWRQVRFLQYADVFAFVLPLGCAIGRIGCFLIHDHPGILSDSFLSVAYPDGARLDHGFLLSLLNLAIFSIFLVMRRIRPRHHFPYLALYAIIYGTARFALDFLRAWDLPAADVRYFWLTPAQYSALAVLLAGVWLMLKSRRPAPPKLTSEKPDESGMVKPD